MVNVSKKTNTLVKAAFLLTLGFLLTYFEFPVLPAFPWLKVDLSAVPVLLSGFAFGPLVGVGVEVLKNLLIFTLKGSSSGGVGEIANIIIVGSYVFTASLIFKKMKTMKGAIIGTLAGAVLMIPLAMLANHFILIPLYFPEGLGDFYAPYMFQGIPLFNLIKGLLISAVGILFYSKVSVLINKEAGFRPGYRKTSKIAG
ncbi:ECF transporter S component [Proteiniclasticum sp. BAD-10]|uniref:Riboflavin transporter n=1 Tax=Proteiniclasticum sediminis TaxID=2804028 RepID=A0A941CLB5_9CLOT|nr:ECF transporter S component [Proteiniclasticum sediminis]MBR0574741.1 ECF transporter S component [Proteiniclasticum sediminis]